ncbi:hypothetical protein J421_5722 (plasmid) [Gemmatirosa kalamazoonensis]|uniref:Uncharacterized protein n=1 Tax=Gemmatirosa kalamazoonensis TaxID=861299 RepID=W0RS32_9BACT|nr:hypothetical protein [Gemmatirosa kalamazoonensis]AHG93257.1 hypothetical protein J421_5722 [Gemmatirosa kalamazoonensis]
MHASARLVLALHGLDALHERIGDEFVSLCRHELDPLVQAAGRSLGITLRHTAHGDLELHFDVRPEMGPERPCGFAMLGEGGDVVVVEAHRSLGVCTTDPVTGKIHRRGILTYDVLLARALFNTGMHELGHFVAALPHVHDPNNYMVTGNPPVDMRTRRGRRAFFAGSKRFTSEQRGRLVEQLRSGTWLEGSEE